MPGNMQGQTTGRQQGLAERLIRSPKGDPLDPAAILATDKAAYVIPADDIGLEHPCGGKDETGPRIAGAARRQMFQRLDKFNIGVLPFSILYLYKLYWKCSTNHGIVKPEIKERFVLEDSGPHLETYFQD